MRQGIYRGCSGFTLLELLISITLISVIVVILAMSIRTGLRAYVRGREANRGIVAVAAVQGLLGRQLMMAVRPGTSDLAKTFRFKGEKDRLVFTTTHAPMGAQAGGVFLVSYRFYDSEDTLIYAQRIVTVPDDVKADTPGRVEPDEIKKLREEGWEVSIVPGIESVSFSYLNHDRDMDLDSLDNWPSTWLSNSSLPAAVGMIMVLKDKERETGREERLLFEIPSWKAEQHRQLFGP